LGIPLPSVFDGLSDQQRGRPGFYFRVVEEGEVEAGDEIVEVAAGPEHMSVFKIIGYCRLVTISTDNFTETNEYRSGVGAKSRFVSSGLIT
jgi:MOSC domain-containing protein YiiM